KPRCAFVLREDVRAYRRVQARQSESRSRAAAESPSRNGFVRTLRGQNATDQTSKQVARCRMASRTTRSWWRARIAAVCDLRPTPVLKTVGKRGKVARLHGER